MLWLLFKTPMSRGEQKNQENDLSLSADKRSRQKLKQGKNADFSH